MVKGDSSTFRTRGTRPSWAGPGATTSRLCGGRGAEKATNDGALGDELHDGSFHFSWVAMSTSAVDFSLQTVYS